jgi:hypothetical protein
VITGDASLAHALVENREVRRRFAQLLTCYPSNYRPWDLTYSDLDRVASWRNDFETQVASGSVPSLEYIWLPNDHTGGTDAHYLNPNQLVAQNDAALGEVVRAIAHSPMWPQSLIIVEEDDAQNGPDHVDATRTVALVAGPNVRRGVLVSDRYDQLSVLRTIELVLGVDPLNLNDRLAVPMFGVFTDRADLTPYDPPAPSQSLTEDDRRRYAALAK